MLLLPSCYEMFEFLSVQCRATLDSAVLCTKRNVELRATRYFTVLCVILPKLLPSSGCSLKSEDHKFFGKLIWTRVVKFTKNNWTVKGCRL
jgi:hypothetical protein